jgi:hypothetical protein
MPEDGQGNSLIELKGLKLSPFIFSFVNQTTNSDFNHRNVLDWDFIFTILNEKSSRYHISPCIFCYFFGRNNSVALLHG